MRGLQYGIVFAILVTLAGCETTTEYVTPELPLPARPELRKIPSDDLECLSDRAYTDIVVRDRQLREYAEQLEAVIRSTHGDGD